MYFRGSSAPMLAAEADRPSLVEGAMRTGRSLRRWALAAMVTLESVTPAASLPSVLPVQGQMMSKSRSFFGPMGSASRRLEMTRRSQMRSISRIRSWAVPNRVSVPAAASETMGTTRENRAFTCSSASMALACVQKDPHTANPTVLSSKESSPFQYKWRKNAVFPEVFLVLFFFQKEKNSLTVQSPSACYRWCPGWPLPPSPGPPSRGGPAPRQRSGPDRRRLPGPPRPAWRPGPGSDSRV